MSGALWAVVAGVGFGIFQAFNRRAVYGMDAYMSTFLQLLISGLVLGTATMLTVDPAILKTVSLATWINFSLAGFFHFFIGWTLLNASQKKIGAARTSPLIGTTPLFGAVVGWLFFAEYLNLPSWIGIFLIIVGVYLVTRPTSDENGDTVGGARSWRDYIFAIGASLAWSISPIFIRAGLAELNIPILGVTVGMVASAIAYIIPLYLRSRRKEIVLGEISRDALIFKLIAGVLVGVSTWARWVALDLTSVAAVLAITMISTPLVLLISPFLMGKHLERVTIPLVAGAGLVIGGALILVLIP